MNMISKGRPMLFALGVAGVSGVLLVFMGAFGVGPVVAPGVVMTFSLFYVLTAVRRFRISGDEFLVGHMFWPRRFSAGEILRSRLERLEARGRPAVLEIYLREGKVVTVPLMSFHSAQLLQLLEVRALRLQTPKEHFKYYFS